MSAFTAFFQTKIFFFVLTGFAVSVTIVTIVSVTVVGKPDTAMTTTETATTIESKKSLAGNGKISKKSNS